MFLCIDQSFDIKNILLMMYETFWTQIKDFKMESKAMENILDKSKLDEIYWMIRTNKITQKDLKLKTIEIIKETMQGNLDLDISFLYYRLYTSVYLNEPPPENNINWEMAATCQEDKALGKNLILFSVLQNLIFENLLVFYLTINI